MAHNRRTIDLSPSSAVVSSFSPVFNHNNKSSLFLAPSVLCYTTEGLIDNNPTPEFNNSHQLQQQATIDSVSVVPHNGNINNEGENHIMDALDDQFTAMEIANLSQDSHLVQVQQQLSQLSLQAANTTSATSFHANTVMDLGLGNSFLAHPAHPVYDYYDSGYSYFGNYPPVDSIYPANVSLVSVAYCYACGGNSSGANHHQH
ncbi:hypothetical protein EC991_005601 [Linnemannia zychae]|nr:hypothetical protein EC991_005601 [Linnemannia zychae]